MYDDIGHYFRDESDDEEDGEDEDDCSNGIVGPAAAAARSNMIDTNSPFFEPDEDYMF